MARDEFSQQTKEIIAKRVGYLCSFPGCGNITFSASDEDDLDTSSTGMACHIAAASEGKNAKRYDKNMTSEQRCHANNGIWMCYKHGKLVDTDESRFTVKILEHWKCLAEGIARLMHEKSIEYSKALEYKQHYMLAENEITVESLGAENEIIGNSLLDSCIHLVWGNSIMNALRDFLIEQTRNAFEHGQAKLVNIKIDFNKITITDNGIEFSPRQLLDKEEGRGGKISFKYLLDRYVDSLILTSQRIDEKNVTVISILDEAEAILDVSPQCTISMSLHEFKHGMDEYSIHETCQDLFVLLPRFFTHSDFSRLHQKRNTLLDETRPITFIGENLSEMVVFTLKQKYPDSKLIIVK